MKTNPLKLLGTGLVVLGAIMLLVASFFFTNLLETPFNIYILLALLFCIGGLIVHIILNKRLPLDDVKEDADVPEVYDEKVPDVYDEDTVTAKKA